MNPAFKTLFVPILKKLIRYAFRKLEDYAIDQVIEILDKDGDKKLSKQELKEWKTTKTYFNKLKPLLKK